MFVLGLAVYALTCMAIMSLVMFNGFDELVNKAPPGTRSDLFIVGIILTILTSPFSMPGIVVKIIKRLWREAEDQCQSLEEDQR